MSKVLYIEGACWSGAFHGNRNEVAAAFHYRIYDAALLKKIKTAAETIIKESRRGRR